MAKKMGIGTADATLVSAAFRLGESYVPGDYSKIFQLQYEGLIAAHQAKADASAKVWKSMAEGAIEVDKAKKAEDEEMDKLVQGVKDEIGPDFDSQVGDATNTVTDGTMQENQGHYEENGPLSEPHQDAPTNGINALKERFEELNKKWFLSPEEKKEKKKIKKQIQDFKPNLIKSKAEISTSVLGWNQGLYNKEQSFKGKPNLQALWNLIIDPNTTTKELEKQGVKISWENGIKKYKYQEGLLGSLYNKEQKKNEDVTTTQSSQSAAVGANGEWKEITEKDLFAQLKKIDQATVDGANTVDAEALKNVDAVSTNKLTGGKYMTVKDFDAIKDKVLADHTANIKKSTNLNDVFTRDVLIGNKTRNYKNDLGSNSEIDIAIINQLGIGSDVFTAEELADGKIDANELAKHEAAKAEIIGKLTNPLTSQEREIAINEYAKYRTNITRGAFDSARMAFNAATAPADGSDKTGKSQVGPNDWRTFETQQTKVDDAKEGKTLYDWKGGKWTTNDGGITYSSSDYDEDPRPIADLLSGPYFRIDGTVMKGEIFKGSKDDGKNPFGTGSVAQAPADFIEAVDEDNKNVVTYLTSMGVDAKESGNWDNVKITAGNGTTKIFTVDPQATTKENRANEIWKFLFDNYKETTADDYLNQVTTTENP